MWSIIFFFNEFDGIHINSTFLEKCMMEIFLYLNQPLRCNIRGPNSSGTSVFPTSLILKITNEHNKIYLSSPSLHHKLYQNLTKYFNNKIPIHIIPIILKEEDIDVVTEEIVCNKYFLNLGIERETFESIEKLKYPKDYENGVNIILDDLNEKEMNNPRAQTMFKRSRDKNLTIFIFSQD